MWLYIILGFFTIPLIHIFWLEKYSGMKNVPSRGPIIIAPNHQSWIDPFILGTALKKRRLFYLVGDFIYVNKIVGWCIDSLGYIKVDRKEPDKSKVYKDASEILSKGRALVVFPEGRLSKDGYTQKGFKGVAKMALENKVDIVPTVIRNSYHIYPAHRKTPYWWGKRCCEVKFLEKLKYEDFKDLPLETIVHDLIMKEICAELGHPYEHKDFEKDLKK